MSGFPSVYPVPTPPAGTLHGDRTVSVRVPGSKSITNRALLLAALANGKSTLHGCLTSDDARYFLQCLRDLGFEVTEEKHGIASDVTVHGLGGQIPNRSAPLYVGSAGTAARFLTAMLAFTEGEHLIDASAQMRARPMQPLIDCLRQAGAEVRCIEKEGHFPLKLRGVNDPAALPRRLMVDIGQSSQFLSALLIALGALQRPFEIVVTGTHGLRYIDLTADMMADFGVSVQKETCSGQPLYALPAQGGYRACDYAVEPDVSAACYFYALAALLGVRLRVYGVSPDAQQGDLAFLQILKRMGCTCEPSADGIIVCGPTNGRLSGGFTADLAAFSDQALTLAALVPFADAPITITGIGHIRLQECDRIHAIVHNLTGLGVRVEETADSVTVWPGQPHGAALESFGDHRVAMAFTLVGLRVPGVQIADPACCKKTFAEYLDVLEKALADLQA